MPGTNNTMDELIIKYLDKSLSIEEQGELNNWISASADNKQLFDKLTKKEWVSNELKRFYEYDEEKGWGKVKKSLPFKTLRPAQGDKGIKKYNWWRVAVAASIILTMGIGSYFIFFNRGKQNEIVKTTTKPLLNDVAAPTETKAMITLANGQKILLDSLTSGTLAKQGNVNVLKMADGQIVYNGSANAIEYNTLFNPRGSKVQPLTLSDGTKVWLNSESSIRFQTAFSGNERNVEITGEAYFEAAHETARPFIVKDINRGTEVQVLGTHFNVNTYADEAAMKVTLLEGSVKVVKGTAINILKPGQQAQIGNNIKIISAVDIDEVMAWKNGRFQFYKASLQEVMRQIARWYDVEIVYEGKIAPQQFGGKMQRDLKLSEVLEGLAKSQVYFRIEGKKVVVMP